MLFQGLCTDAWTRQTHAQHQGSKSQQGPKLYRSTAATPWRIFSPCGFFLLEFLRKNASMLAFLSKENSAEEHYRRGRFSNNRSDQENTEACSNLLCSCSPRGIQALEDSAGRQASPLRHLLLTCSNIYNSKSNKWGN